jgi:hypothetical protein
METNVDMIVNKGNGSFQANGLMANQVLNNGRLDIGMMRPFIDERTGKAYVTIYKGGNPKSPASYITQALQTNAGTLRRDEWKQLDEALVMVSRYRLGGIQDLIDNGLVYNLGNAMGTTVLEWHDVSDSMSADVTMDGVTRSKGDRPVFQYNYLPIPIIHVDYEINARVLAASRNMGNPLDTTGAEAAARRVQEALENMLFTNTTYSFGEKDSRNLNTIYSYINHPDRCAVRLSIPWDHSAITAAGILQDVQDMKAALVAKFQYGPYMIYIPTAYERCLDDDYGISQIATATQLTIRERILKLSNIKGIKVVDTLPNGNVLMVQMQPQTVRLIRGLPLQNVEWETEGKFISKFKVLTIQVPQIRSDQNNNCGIAHLS